MCFTIQLLNYIYIYNRIIDFFNYIIRVLEHSTQKVIMPVRCDFNRYMEGNYVKYDRTWKKCQKKTRSTQTVIE